MKILNKTGLRVAGAAVFLAASSLVSVGTASADPSDAVCIMPPEDYCTYIEGHTFNTPGYRACIRWAWEQQQSEFCNWPEW